jgi:hypothetical protein
LNKEDAEMLRLLVAAVINLVLLSGVATAQEHRPAAAPHHALPPNSAFVVDGNGTSVQLPTFNFFTISTSVLVPDRGSVAIGGMNSGTAAQASSGLPVLGQRSLGVTHGVGGMSVGAQIHDLKAMDRELLADAAANKQDGPLRAWTERVERAKQSSAGRPTISVAEARRLRGAAGAVR